MIKYYDLIIMGIYTENRPWGKFEKFHENENCTVKLIYVNANSRLSLQYHQHRSEFWKIVKGKAKIDIDKKELVVKENENISIHNTPRILKYIQGALTERVKILCTTKCINPL